MTVVVASQGAALVITFEREPCPHCDDRGWYEDTTTGYGHDCGGDPDLCEVRCPIPVPELVQVQCPCGGQR